MNIYFAKIATEIKLKNYYKEHKLTFTQRHRRFYFKTKCSMNVSVLIRTLYHNKYFPIMSKGEFIKRTHAFNK